MIVEWLLQLPVLAVAVAVVFVPGLLALRFAGLRGLALLAAAPLFTVAATAVIALVLGLVGVPWSVLSWAAAMAVLILISVVVLGYQLLMVDPTVRVVGQAYSMAAMAITVFAALAVVYMVDRPFNDRGAEIGEHLRAPGPGEHAREIEDGEMRERAGHVFAPCVGVVAPPAS